MCGQKKKKSQKQQWRQKKRHRLFVSPTECTQLEGSKFSQSIKDQELSRPCNKHRAPTIQPTHTYSFTARAHTHTNTHCTRSLYMHSHTHCYPPSEWPFYQLHNSHMCLRKRPFTAALEADSLNISITHRWVWEALPGAEKKEHGFHDAISEAHTGYESPSEA